MLSIGPVGQELDSSGVCDEVGDKGDSEDIDNKIGGFRDTCSVLALEYCDGIPRPEGTLKFKFS